MVVSFTEIHILPIYRFLESLVHKSEGPYGDLYLQENASLHAWDDLTMKELEEIAFKLKQYALIVLWEIFLVGKGKWGRLQSQAFCSYYH